MGKSEEDFIDVHRVFNLDDESDITTCEVFKVLRAGLDKVVTEDPETYIPRLETTAFDVMAVLDEDRPRDWKLNYLEFKMLVDHYAFKTEDEFRDDFISVRDDLV